MAATPLPPNPFEESTLSAAYARCLALEAVAPEIPDGDSRPGSIKSARLLGHLLRLSPVGNGQGQVKRDIKSAMDNDGLLDVANFYLVYFVRTFKRSTGTTPAPSEHPSRPSFRDARQYTMAVMEQGSTDRRTSQEAAMLRDDYRCMITGVRDSKHGGILPSECAHIIPEGTNTNTEQVDKKRHYSAKVWSMLSMFTDVDILEELAGDRVHRLENILTLNFVCHRLFDELVLWLKPADDGTLNTYRVCVNNEELRHFHFIPQTATFSTTTELPLPNPALIAIHALCCEVAWMSGAVEYIMDIEQRMDQIRVLAEDGSTAGLLSSALQVALVETW